jgi:DNA-binding NarL/FixJ family response regulator
MTSTTFIALIDDHTLLRSGLAALINSFEGYKVLLEAENGRDFIDRLQPRQAPDIVLLDISMPVLNGYETAEWIRMNLPETKVIVLSMMDSDTAIIRMLRYGARGYILKDSKPAVFRQALDIVRDKGFYTNDLVSSRMWNYMNKESAGPAHAADLPVHLTDRELHFLKLACTEKTYKEIADEMFISPRTVDGYRDALYEKLGISSRVGLVLFAIKNGMVTL